MEYDSDCKIVDCCAKASAVEAYLSPWIEGSRMIATDGHMLASVSITGTDLSDGSVPAKLLKSCNGTVQLTKETATSNGFTVNRAQGGPTPRVDQVLPGIDDWPKRKPDLIIDAALLYRLAHALGAGKSTRPVQLWLGSGSEAILVAPGGSRSIPRGATPLGVIMPVK